MVFGEVLIHLDFKGAPPKFDFLVDLIKFISRKEEKIVTGFLIEFEDMLPFMGNLQCIRNDRYPCYTKEEVNHLVNLIVNEP